MTVDMKALKEAGGLVERLRDGASGLRAAFDLPDGMNLQEATLMHDAASTILSLIERCEELEAALSMLRNTAGDLKNGFAPFVEPSRWVDQFQAVADAALSKADATS